MRQPNKRSRGGFWRRVWAITIDCVLVSSALSLAGLALVIPTDGRIRTSNVPISSTACDNPNVNRAEFNLPADFRIDRVERCTQSVFGFAFDRQMTFTESTRSGSVTYTRSVSFPTDANARSISALYIDYVLPILLAAYLIVLEWRFGTTVGKRMLGLRVRSAGGGKVRLSQAVRRSVVRVLPILPFYLLIFAAFVFPSTQIFSWLLIVGGITLVLSAALAVNFIVRVRKADVPWHDEWAGTEVIHDRATE
jgi:uncharacterized RDD family membrane protein YckC